MKKVQIFNKIPLDAPSTFLNPVPVIMLSCRGTSKEYDKPNIITLAWAGTINSEPPMLSVSVRKSRFSHKQILESGEFVVNLVSEELLEACDFCGVKSGRDLDKFEKCKLITEKANGLEIAPSIKNSPVSISCKITQVIELGSHDMFLAEIVAVDVAENLFRRNGKIDLGQAKLVTFSHGEYWSLKETIGFLGYSVAADDVKARRMPKRRREGLPVKSKKKKK